MIAFYISWLSNSAFINYKSDLIIKAFIWNNNGIRPSRPTEQRWRSAFLLINGIRPKCALIRGHRSNTPEIIASTSEWPNNRFLKFPRDRVSATNFREKKSLDARKDLESRLEGPRRAPKSWRDRGQHEPQRPWNESHPHSCWHLRGRENLAPPVHLTETWRGPKYPRCSWAIPSAFRRNMWQHSSAHLSCKEFWNSQPKSEDLWRRDRHIQSCLEPEDWMLQHTAPSGCRPNSRKLRWGEYFPNGGAISEPLAQPHNRGVQEEPLVNK